ncbi:hypothetical protein [Microcoleus sp. CAWBG58]|uniref:hypothetical protein n=1 Tax=Microcoleus sp. CAWBG58 TaxID=2841651 RepID=UPI0025E74420|nr:hypothetical protein [Microcoleus sp. CAWBG58]
MPYIEVKTRKKIGLTLARKIVNKGNVSAVLTTGKITDRAKKMFNENDIAYAENIPDTEFMSCEAEED